MPSGSSTGQNNQEFPSEQAPALMCNMPRLLRANALILRQSLYEPAFHILKALAGKRSGHREDVNARFATDMRDELVIDCPGVLERLNDIGVVRKLHVFVLAKDGIHAFAALPRIFIIIRN